MPIVRRGRRVTPLAAMGSSAAWTPLSLSGLLSWYKADTGLYTDTGGTTPATTNGASVARWNDQSGNGYHLTNTTADSTQYPTLATSSLNGLATLAFDRTVNDQGLYTGATSVSLGTTTASVFIVAKTVEAVNTNDAFVSFLGNGDVNAWAATTSANFILTASTGAIKGVRNSVDPISQESISNSTFQQWGIIFDGSTGTTYVSNTAGTPTASTGTFAATGQLSVGLWLQSAIASIPQNPLKGSIAEVVVTNSALSSTDRSNLASYLLARWGV